MLTARVNREPLSAFVRATTVAVLSAVTVSIGVATVSGNTVSGNTEVPARPDVRLTSPGTLPVLVPEPEPRALEPHVARAPLGGPATTPGRHH